MKIKKLLSIILAGSLVLSLTACAPKKSGNTAADSTNGDKKTEGEVTEIRFTEWDGGETLAVYEAIAEKFNAEHPDIKVTVMNIPDEYDTKITSMVAGNDIPEVSILNADTLLFPLAEEGVVLNMQEYAQKDSEFDMASMGDQFKYMYSKDYMAGYGIGSENMCMFYNPSLFEKYNVEEPPASYENAWDWDTFVNNAKQLTIDKNGKNALDPEFDPKKIEVYGVKISKFWGGYMPFLSSVGGDYLANNGTEIGYATQEGVDVLQKLSDLTYVHHVAPTPTANETMPGLSESLVTNKVAMCFDGQWSNAALMADEVKYNVAALPKMGEKGKTVMTYGSICLMNTDKADAAWEFIKYMLSEGACQPLYESGLWLPTNTYEYTDEYIQSIITDKHPANYYESIVKPMIDGTADVPIVARVKNFNKINDIITPALDDLWSGEKTAEEAIGGIKSRADKEVKGYFGE